MIKQVEDLKINKGWILMTIMWSEQLSVGNTVIDDEHKHLICLINSVEIALQAEEHVSMLQFLIEQLEKYTRNHFFQEEELMLEHKFAGYADHKIEHQKIIENINKLKSEFSIMADNKQQLSQFEANLVKTLRSWVIDHVINSDLKLKPLFIN